MGWGFVPLTQYHGGGAAATLEPLHEHLGAYHQLMMQYYGAGIQACYRGPRLYDSKETRKMVKSTISWYKKHRLILNSDLLHLRRPDGRDWDGFMHVNAGLKEKALIMVFNPGMKEIQRHISIPLYYTGIRNTAKVIDEKGAVAVHKPDDEKNIEINISIPAAGYRWFIIE